MEGATEHRVRAAVLFRGVFALISVGGFGATLVVLAALGEIEGWSGGLVGAILIGLASLVPRTLLGDWRRRLTLDDECVSSAPDGVRVPWSEIQKVNYVTEETTSGTRTSEINLHTRTGVVLAFGRNLTDWESIERRVRARFGSPNAG